MAIDPETYRRYLLSEQKAKELGLALPEVLDRAQLLLTQKRRQSIEVEVLENIWRRLDRQAPHKLMSYYSGQPDGSSAEMFEAMKLWFEIVIKNIAQGTLEEL